MQWFPHVKALAQITSLAHMSDARLAPLRKLRATDPNMAETAGSEVMCWVQYWR